MSRTLQFIFCFLLSSSFVIAQQPVTSSALQNKIAPVSETYYTGFEEIRSDVPIENTPFVNVRTDVESIIGTTVYDLQTNSSVRNALERDTDGNMAGVWTMGFSSGDGYSDRGSGYNTGDGTGWGASPSARIESERTGWPNVVTLGDGSQFVVAHTVANEFITNRNASGAWEEDKIPTSIPVGILWPRAAGGGPDGMSVHVIGISTPSGLGGGAYEGSDGHIVYFRSTDGGATWDKTDVIIPGIDSSSVNSMDPDGYAIDVNGETIAIGVYADFGNSYVSKSTDNGETWETWIINDWAVDNYVAGSGWSIDDLEPEDTIGGPGGDNALALLSTDNCGDIIIDNDGNIHTFYGEMYYNFVEGTGDVFFPGWAGVRYWREDFGEDSTVVVAGLIDSDGDGVFTTVNPAGSDFGVYGTSLTSFISCAVDAENNLYVGYSAVTENFVNQNANPEPQHNRHIFITASMDGGDTWLDTPVDVIREDVIIEPDLISAVEAVYPSLARNVDGKVHLIYQQDFEPGVSISGDTDPASTNFINYLGVSIEEFGGETNIEIVDKDLFKFNLAPNPATDFVQISYELPETAKVTMTLTNMMGQTIRTVEAANHFAGSFSKQMNISDLATGVYLVQFRANDQVAVQKLVVE